MEDIARFLAAYPPFNQLAFERVKQIADSMQIEYFAANQDILVYGGEPTQFLYVVCRGSVDLLRERDGEVQVFDTLGEGEAFGHPSLIRHQSPVVTVRTHTEVLAYLLPADLFHQLRSESSAFAQFFAASALERLDYALEARHADAAPVLFQTRLSELVHRDVITIAADASVREAAQLMRAQNVSCLVVDTAPPGILTDRDLRNRVLADGLSDTTAVHAVATAPAQTLPSDSLVFEGLLLMLERGIHHLPVTNNAQVVGLVTHTDILRQQSQSPLFLPRQLERAKDIADLRRYAQQVTATVGSLLDAGARIGDIGRVVALAHDALLVRLLRDTEHNLGPPPCAYAWLVMGSEGRYEQTLRTDQDNALIYADHAPADVDNYFAALAEQVVQGLVACGFPPCPGDNMATNSRWRQPLSVWQRYFHTWIEQPDEENLLQVGIFFDYRQVHGALDAEAALRPIVRQAQDNQIFLSRLARTSLRQAAPLGVFRQIVLERHGDQRHVIDLKQRGTALLVDLARLFALEAGITQTNTLARLRNAWPKSNLSENGAENLHAAFELISLLRLRHQYRQIERGEQPTNYIVYRDLSALERRELKGSLQAIARVQRNVETIFQTGLLG